MNVERMNHKWSVNLVAIFDNYFKLGQEHCKEYNDEAELYTGYHYLIHTATKCQELKHHL